MSKYYFHLKRNQEYIHDDLGRDLPDVMSAYRHAVKMADSLTRHLDEMNEERGWIIRITKDGEYILDVIVNPCASASSSDSDRPAVPKPSFGNRR